MNARPPLPSGARPDRRSVLLALTAVSGSGLLTACGAGSEAGGAAPGVAGGDEESACPIEDPAEPTTVNVLSYTSTATEPWHNAMAQGCTTGNLTVQVPPTDLGGQNQRAIQSLSGETASYDIIESYGSVRPLYAERGWVIPLDDYIEQYSEQFAMDQIDPALLEAVQYEGATYTIPTFWGTTVMVYRQDVMEQLGAEVPTTFAELVEVAQAIKDAGLSTAPLAIPYNPAGDIASQFNQAYRSLGGSWFEEGTDTPTLDNPLAVQAVEALTSLRPVMSEQVLSFSSPEVLTQLQTGQAVIGLLLSGRVADLTDPSKTEYADQFAFAVPPAVQEGGGPMTYLSVDGFCVAANSQVDPELLFQLVAVGTGVGAAEAASEVTIPARTDIADAADLPAKDAAQESLQGAEPLPQVPYMSDVYGAVGAPIGRAVAGEIPAAQAVAEAQAAAAAAITAFTNAS